MVAEYVQKWNKKQKRILPPPPHSYANYKVASNPDNPILLTFLTAQRKCHNSNVSEFNFSDFLWKIMTCDAKQNRLTHFKKLLLKNKK